MKISFKRIHPDGQIPTYAKENDAGADLTSVVKVVINPGERYLVPTGIAIALPNGYVGLVHPRSGLALKHGISIVNTPGTIDAGYRGEIMVTIINHDLTNPFQIEVGDRIAQLVIQQVEHATFEEVESLPESDRGSSGFGSSGIRHA